MLGEEPKGDTVDGGRTPTPGIPSEDTVVGGRLGMADSAEREGILILVALKGNDIPKGIACTLGRVDDPVNNCTPTPVALNEDGTLNVEASKLGRVDMVVMGDAVE